MNRKQTLPEGTPGVLGGMFAGGTTSVETDIRTGRTLAQFPRHAGARRGCGKGKQDMSPTEACYAKVS